MSISLNKIGEPPYKLNVGCGNNTKEGWVNLDGHFQPGIDIITDLEEADICLPDNSVEVFFLSHILEHIKNALGLMEELYRIALPDAKMIIKVPHGGSDVSWEDQTHIREYFPGSFRYFSQPLYWRADYGYKADWQPDMIQLLLDKERFENMDIKEALKVIHKERNAVKEMVCEMSAIKPARGKDKNEVVNSKILLTLV